MHKRLQEPMDLRRMRSQIQISLQPNHGYWRTDTGARVQAKVL